MALTSLEALSGDGRAAPEVALRGEQLALQLRDMVARTERLNDRRGDMADIAEHGRTLVRRLAPDTNAEESDVEAGRGNAIARS